MHGEFYVLHIITKQLFTIYQISPPRSRPAAEVRRDVARLFTEEIDGRLLTGGGVASFKKPLHTQTSLVS